MSNRWKVKEIRDMVEEINELSLKLGTGRVQLQEGTQLYGRAWRLYQLREGSTALYNHPQYIGSKWGKDDRGLKCIAGMVNGNKADAQLIADAPLFLEAYKRLREELFDTHAFYSNMEQMLAFAVGIKQGLLTDMSMDNLVDAVNRDYHDRLNEHMDGRLRKND